MTAATPKPLWEGMNLGQIYPNYIELNDGKGSAVMVLRHLPLHSPGGALSQSFCEAVGELLTQA